MEEKIRSRFSDQILAEARQRYTIAPDKIAELGGFESFIYSFEKNGAQYVLRLGHSLRRTPANAYGLIHQDAHTGNLFVDENGRITLFDFDDCVYGHFIYDIAMVLFYAVTNRLNAVKFCAEFWPLFWQGYREENELDPVWHKEIPHFMKLREIDLYGVILRDIPDYGDDGWVAGFMQGRQENIWAERPYIDFDFMTL